MQSTPTFDTIILGAGWSGAVAARDLARAGHTVLVLEARDRVGGRAHTWPAPDGTPVDLGCSWIHGYNEGNPARAIAAELNVPTRVPPPAPAVPAQIYGPDGPLPAATAQALGGALKSAQAQFRTPHPAPPPSASLADAFFGPESPLFAAGATASLARGLARTLEVPLGMTLEQASLRWAGWESAQNFAGSDGAPQGGYEGLVAKVLDDAKAAGAQVRVGEPVTRVAVDNDEADDSGAVTVTTAQGTQYTARTVVCTIPLGVLQGLPADFFSPPLPARLAEIVAGTHVGVLEKLVLSYPTAWWPNADQVGAYVFLPESADAAAALKLTPDSPLADVLAACTFTTANLAAGTPAPAPGAPTQSPTLLTYLSERAARAFLQHPTADVAAAFHAFLQRRLGVAATAAPAAAGTVLTRWLSDPLARGATSTPSVVSANGERSPMDFAELARPVWGGRLGFAGEHTDPAHRGSVGGAVVSGAREAGRVGRLLAKIAK